MDTAKQTIEIMGEPTMDPDVCRFTVSLPLYSEGSVDCDNADDAQGSPLLEALFAIDGIREVLVYGNSLTVAKTTDEEWPSLGKKIGAAIREQFATGQPLIAANLKERLPSEMEIRDKVTKLLETEINPYVSSHGGRIDVVDVKGTKVYVSLSGGCQGCASANQTLKLGVEEIVFGNLPEVTEIVDVTDHSSGVNPYYR